MAKTGRVMAKRRFGQHFLQDAIVLGQIQQILAPAAGQKILEIGPGMGALTGFLVESGANLTVVEIDNHLVSELKKSWPNLHILHTDVLQLDLSSLLAGDKWRLVGNLPYNISSQLLVKLPQNSQQIVDGLFMLQEEVAQRLAASTGSKKWGRLSVLMQHKFEVHLLFEVPPEAFRPMPAVQSRMVYIKPRATSLPIQNYSLFLWLLQTIFGQRRKMIGNTLKTLASALPASGIEGLLGDAGLSYQDRAESVSVAAFVQLANALHHLNFTLPVRSKA